MLKSSIPTVGLHRRWCTNTCARSRAGIRIWDTVKEHLASNTDEIDPDAQITAGAGRRCMRGR